MTADAPAAAPRGSPVTRPAFAVKGVTVAVVLVLVATAVGSAVIARDVVRDQQRRLLRERAAEAGEVLSSSFSSVQSMLASLGTIAISTNSSPAAFAKAAKGQSTTGASIALVGSSSAGPVVVAGANDGLTTGTVLSGGRADAVTTALHKPGLAATNVLARTASLVRVGIALGPPQAPPGQVVYIEYAVPRTSAPSANHAFSELNVALYAASSGDPGQLLLATGSLPRGTVARQPVAVGSTKWLLTVSARKPLVGSLASTVPWLLLGLGLLAALLIGAVIQVVSRRRDYAVALVDERTGALQRSLAELEAAQVRLVRQERLAAVGQLASAVGHELRNPLGVITNSLYLIRNATSGTADERLQRHLATAEREVSAATVIVADLLEFARAREPIVQPLDIAGLVSEVVEVVPPPAGTRVVWDPPSDLPPAAGDRDQLRQVLINLVANAYDAMPDGGAVTIRVAAAHDALSISVSDEGQGMDAETRRRLFEPFFTTKAKGTGLGLAVTERIVSAHRGTIRVDSTPGHGATFTVGIPVSAAVAVAHTAGEVAG